MSTQTETAQTAAPEYTSLYRVASIPLVSSSLGSIHSTLSSNAYTKSPYSAATGLAHSAWGYTEPIQARLAPLATRADDFANAGLDVVESRYPYPFKAKPEEITTYVRERRQSALDVTNKTIDEKVKSPAYGVVQGIDQRFAPIVDFFEIQVQKFNSEASPPTQTSDSQYQYQRAYALSRNLTENLVVYSNEHLKQLQTQNVLLQRATQTAHTITDLASSSLANAQTRIHSLSDTMLQELQKLQTSTASLPKSLQSSFPDLGATISEFHNIVTSKDITLNEKATKVGSEVRDRVNPLLEDAMKRVKELVGIATTKKNETVGQVNGHSALG
jgi:hypothetical protein